MVVDGLEVVVDAKCPHYHPKDALPSPDLCKTLLEGEVDDVILLR